LYAVRGVQVLATINGSDCSISSDRKNATEVNLGFAVIIPSDRDNTKDALNMKKFAVVRRGILVHICRFRLKGKAVKMKP